VQFGLRKVISMLDALLRAKDIELLAYNTDPRPENPRDRRRLLNDMLDHLTRAVLVLNDDRREHAERLQRIERQLASKPPVQAS
jgi:hypothetical protein